MTALDGDPDTLQRLLRALASDGVFRETDPGVFEHTESSRLLLAPGWSSSIGGRMRVEQSLLAESWNPSYEQLGFNRDDPNPPFLKPAVSELSKADRTE